MTCAFKFGIIHPDLRRKKHEKDDWENSIIVPFGETVAGLKSYEGDLVSFVLSSLQADILFLSGVIVFLILSILSRQKEILNHQKEQLEASRELQMLLKRREEELFTKKPAENNSTPDASDHTERQEKRDES